jgi:hypothetical protein
MAQSTKAGANLPVQSMQVTFCPSHERISLIRCFVADFYAGVALDPDAADRLGITTYELLDNAAKFTTNDEVIVTIQFKPKSGDIMVRTVNFAEEGEIAALTRRFAEIAAAPDAATLYAEAVRNTAKATGSGGLGLPRIWAESEMELTLSVEGRRVEVVASGHIDVS